MKCRFRLIIVLLLLLLHGCTLDTFCLVVASLVVVVVVVVVRCFLVLVQLLRVVLRSANPATATAQATASRSL